MPPSSSSRAITRERYDALLFDLDGVIRTPPAYMRSVGNRCSTITYRRARCKETKHFIPSISPLTIGSTWMEKPRFDGVRDFLTSRGIQLSEGAPDDPPQAETVYGLGNRKNDLINKVIKDTGVKSFEGSVNFIRQLHHQGYKIAVVTSSRNCTTVLNSAGLD